MQDQRMYHAQTGLENAQGQRVETGATLPPGFAPDRQIDVWLANGDITAVEAVDVDQAMQDADGRSA
ncbi:MAG: hypothetical protein WCF84_26710 [Anaerolineae bacterium]